MKVISIGTDRKMFEDNSAVRRRNIEYGKFFEETHVIVFSTKKSRIESFGHQISENVWIYPTNSGNKFLYAYDALQIAKTLSSKFKTSDWVVTVGDPFETGMAGVLIKLFLNLPLHVQVHTDFMHKYFRKLSILNKLRFLAAEFVLRYSDRVRTVSERVGRSIGQFSKNIDVFPIKTEVKVHSSKLKKKWGEEINVLTVCRLEKEKNLETAIKAFKIISEELSNVTFTIVGDGSEKENLKLVAKGLKVEDKVKFVGWKEDLEEYYQNADIYISTSFYEGYGISTVEAAYFEIPLVLSDTGLAGDVFKNADSAFICDALDVEKFAGNVLRICRDINLSQKMGKCAREEAEKHLNQNANYSEKYAESIIKTADNFRKINFISRIFDFKKTVFNSFIYLRYFLCGITSAAVNIVSLYVFTDITSIWYLYSSIFAFLLSLLVSFTLQKFVVFKNMQIGKIHHQFSKFFIAAVLGIITNTLLMLMCVEVFGIWYIFSQIIAGFFVMIQNFILYKFFIFNK